MAENEYRRLACQACCVQMLGVFALRKTCSEACRNDFAVAAARERSRRNCVTCSVSFTCADKRSARRWCSEDCKPKELRGIFRCRHCCVEYKKRSFHKGEGETYCTRQCAGKAKRLAAEVKRGDGRQPLSTYIAKFCGSCGKGWGERREWSKCLSCRKAALAEAARTANRALNEAKHKAAGKVVRCCGCRAEFCPLYGHKHGGKPYCSPCRAAVLREERRAKSGSARQRAKKYGAYCERFDPIQVLERDRWRCQLCRRKTPKALRGTCAPNAPELDHIVALALGGPHTMANCQCLCRACNSAKGATALGQMHLAMT